MIGTDSIEFINSLAVSGYVKGRIYAFMDTFSILSSYEMKRCLAKNPILFARFKGVGKKTFAEIANVFELPPLKKLIDLRRAEDDLIEKKTANKQRFEYTLRAIERVESRRAGLFFSVLNIAYAAEPKETVLALEAYFDFDRAFDSALREVIIAEKG